MLENILDDITRQPMDRLGRNLGGHIPSCPRHVRHDAVAMAKFEMMKFGTQQQVRPQWQSRDQILKFLKFKMADGRHVGKYSKCHNSPTNGPTGTQIGWSHPIVSPTCPPWCGCHGNGRCLATTHCIFSSYGRLETERVNQFWWNLVSKCKLGPQWQSRDQILFF